MKTSQVLIWIALAFIGGLGWGLWLNERGPNSVVYKGGDSSSRQPSRTNSPNPSHNMMGIPNQNLWLEYNSVRQNVLQNDSELAAEYKDLQGQISAERNKLNAAMIRVDPRAAPIIDKLNALHAQGTGAKAP